MGANLGSGGGFRCLGGGDGCGPSPFAALERPPRCGVATLALDLVFASLDGPASVLEGFFRTVFRCCLPTPSREWRCVRSSSAVREVTPAPLKPLVFLGPVHFDGGGCGYSCPSFPSRWEEHLLPCEQLWTPRHGIWPVGLAWPTSFVRHWMPGYHVRHLVRLCLGLPLCSLH